MLLLDQDNVDDLFRKVLAKYGYDFTDYAKSSLLRRVEFSMQQTGMSDPDEFEKLILNDEKQFEKFVRNITVNVTEMFRDPAYYKSIRENTLKRLETYPVIRIWIAGCSTGEEIYSLCILLHETGLLDKSVIYATDLNADVIEKAKTGVYSLSHMREYIENYRKTGGIKDFTEYYTAKYEAAIIRQFLKKNVVFALHNLSTDNSFNEFQLISCRNVLIYFNQQLQNKTINLFYQSLCPFGMLCLGMKESLIFSDKEQQFSAIDRTHKIYMKRP